MLDWVGSLLTSVSCFGRHYEDTISARIGDCESGMDKRITVEITLFRKVDFVFLLVIPRFAIWNCECFALSPVKARAVI